MHLALAYHLFLLSDRSSDLSVCIQTKMKVYLYSPENGGFTEIVTFLLLVYYNSSSCEALLAVYYGLQQF